MNLQASLYRHCKSNGYEDLSCIIQFALVSYLSSHKSRSEWVYLSPEILNSFIGIGEDNIKALFEHLTDEHSDIFAKSCRIFCPEEDDRFCCAKDYADICDGQIELDCECCNELHIISDLSKLNYEIDYLGYKERIIQELQISSKDLSKELVILSTNEDHINKLADIIVSRLNPGTQNKQEAKKGIVNILSSVKEVSGLISGISGDVADTTDSIKKIIENFTGLSTLKDFLS